MGVRNNNWFAIGAQLALCALALCALALGACAAPPTTTPTPLPSATAWPPTAAPTVETIVTVVSNVPVLATSLSQVGASGVAFDASGNLYVSTCLDGIVYKVDPTGLATRFAGNPGVGFSGDGGPALAAGIACIGGLAFDRDGNLYVADSLNNRIRRIDRNGIINTVAGSGAPSSGTVGVLTGGYGGDGGLATAALLQDPSNIALDAEGNLYIDDAYNERIRKVDRQGIITTVAGTGTPGFSGDGGPATAAQLGRPRSVSGYFASNGIALDAQDNLYISDSGNNRVRKIDKQGIISTIAGIGDGPVVSGDGGPATAAVLASPNGLAFDAAGNLFIAEGNTDFLFDSRVRKVDLNGIITTVAGSGAGGYAGDSGAATAALLNLPAGLAFDPTGNLYIADFFNARVRKVDANGIITTVFGGHF